MASNPTNADRIDPSEQIPEADLLEQQAPLDPWLTNDERRSIDRVDRAASADLVDEGDRWEQQQPVPSVDDDYPHDNPGNVFEAG